MIGVPQKRWRETHQSGRCSIISYMRSSPQERNPFHFVNFFEGFRAKSLQSAVCGLIHFDEPLFGGAEDDGIVAAPAVGIAVFVMLMAEKRAALLE